MYTLLALALIPVTTFVLMKYRTEADPSPLLRLYGLLFFGFFACALFMISSHAMEAGKISTKYGHVHVRGLHPTFWLYTGSCYLGGILFSSFALLSMLSPGPRR